MRMRVTNDMQLDRPCSFSSNAAVLDQEPPNALPSKLWLDEQGIQLRMPVGARQDGGEASQRTGHLGNENMAAFNGLKRKSTTSGLASSASRCPALLSVSPSVW